MSTAKELYKTLTQCCEILEENVVQNLKQFEELTSREQYDMKIDQTKELHFKEIFFHLKQVKFHIDSVRHHDTELQSLIQPQSQTKIDKNYIKRQVDTFQRLSNDYEVPKREHKSVRKTESAMKYLESWENFWQTQDQAKVDNIDLATVKKRQNGVRKKKKIRSSTFDMLLDDHSEDHGVMATLEAIEEDRHWPDEEEFKNFSEFQDTPFNTINDPGENEESEETVDELDDIDDDKPRIVDVLYKKNNRATDSIPKD